MVRHSNTSRALILLWVTACGGAAHPELDQAQGATQAQVPGESPRALSATSLVRFRTRVELPLRDKPIGVALADLDGDGLDELAVATLDPGEVLLWQGTGAIPAPGVPMTQVPVGGYPLRPLLIAPHAAHPARLVCAVRATKEVLEFDIELVPGKPPTVSAPRRFALTEAPRVLLAHPTDVGSWLTLGAQGEWLAVDAAGLELRSRIESCRPTTAVWEEESGQLLVGCQERMAVLRLTPPAPGADAAQPTVLAELALPGVPRDLLRADFDGDGDAELSVSTGAREVLTFGLAGSAFEDAPLVLDAGPIPFELFAFPGEGCVDLGVITYIALGYQVQHFDGTAWKRIQSGYSGQTPWQATLGSVLDSRGRDLVLACRDAKAIAFLPGATDQPFADGLRHITGKGPSSLTSLDLQGDGKPETALLHSLDGSLALVSDLASGARVIHREDAGPSAKHLVSGDLDADGVPDLAWTTADAHGARLRIRLGTNAPGLRTPPITLPLLAQASSDLLYATLESPDQPCLYLADPSAGQVIRFDPRAPQEEPRRAQLEAPPHALCTLEREGHSGLVVAVGGAGVEAALLLLSPDLVVRARTVLPDRPIDVISGDWNGDGEQDLAALIGDVGSRVQPLLFRDGQWELLSPVYTGGRPQALACGDCDKDGRDELFIAAQNSHRIDYFAADAQGRFSPRLALGAGAGPLDLCVVDANADGLLDVLVASAFSEDLRFLLGQ